MSATSVTYAACPKCLKMNKISIERAKKTKPVCGACQAEIQFHNGVLDVTLAQARSMITKSPVPVVIDFWAPWCAPCRSFAPTYTSVANEMVDRAVFLKLNTEAEQEAGPYYGIRGIPTLAVFKGGAELERQSGALPQEHLKRWLSSKI